MNYITSLAKFDIIDKEGHRVPFTLNDFQKLYLGKATNRDVILKARQIGYSSLVLAMFTLDFLLKPNSRSVCISHDSPSAVKLFDRVKFFIESAVDKGLAINLKYNSRNEMVNADKNSTFYVGPSGNKSFGRGDTLTNLHLSEYAFYPNQEALLASVLQAVVPNGRVVIESTANGLNYFKTFWDKSKAGETGFQTHFFDNSFYAPEFLNQKKKELGETLFRQEYPTNDVECFLFSGSPFFDIDACRMYLSLAKDPIRTGNFIGAHPPVFEDADGGFWRIWELPKEGHSYIIGCDVAETRDYCSAHVIDRFSFLVVATFHGHLEPGLYGEELDRAGRYYHNALIACEKNNMGIAVIQRLRDLYYPNLYVRKIVDSVTHNEATDIGWITNAKTRPLMLSNLQTVIKQRTLKVYDRDTIKELMAFARNDKGRPEAVQGSFDDRVISLSIAVACYETTPMPVDSWDWQIWEVQNRIEREEVARL